MKNFKLLLKNSLKSLWNSKILVAQFTTLTTIATIVISSVFLGNFSLRNSMSKVTKESNATGFSLENKTVEDFASYNLINESNKISFFDINDLTINDATNNLRQIYNPLMSATTLTVDNKQFETYGFFQKYVNDNYTNNPLSLEWPNIVFSKNGDSLSIVVQSTNPNYKNRVSDIFTLYSNILPPSPSEVDKTKYEVFFNQNIYSFNPWSLFIDANNSMKTNDFDFALIEGFNSDNDINENILYNHGIFDDFYSYIVGTNLTFLDEVSMQPYKNELTKIDSEISLAKTWNDAFINNSKHLSSTNNFADYQAFSNFILKWIPDLGDIYLSNIYSEKYYEFLNKLSADIKDNFMQNTKTFEFNYQINVENSTGLSKFFSDIYYNKNNKFHNQVKNIFTEADKKYFSGSFNIPLIPFITVLPSNNNLTLDETKVWASNYNNYTDPNQSVINYSNLNSIVNKTFNKISEKSNSFFSELLNSSKVSKEIRSEYYKNYDIEYFLSNEMGMDFTKSSNFTLTDTNSNSFIMSKSKYFSENKVNNIVLYEGIELIDAKIYENYLNGIDILDKYKEWINVLNSTSPPTGYNSLEEYQKEYFLNNNEFFITMNLFNQSKLLTNIDIVNSFYSLISNIINIKLMNENFDKWKSETLKFLNTFEASLVSWNGAGYNFEFTRVNDMGIRIDLVANYYEPSSYMAIVGLNYSQLKNNNKKIIDSEFAQQACKLPYKSKEITDDDLLNNYEKYQSHYIYNPYSEKVEFYNDFLDWMSRLDSQYKINISGDEFVILGKGITTEFVYPIVSNNQLLINNNSPVIFTNELGYDKVFLNYGIQQTTNYFVNFNHKFDYLQNNEDLKRINNWTSRVNNEKLAYRLNDPKQPNQLLYLRINFPSSILNIVLIITIFIGAIIVLLSLTFIFVLMKSIIKQNLNTFAVGMANGISKRKLLFSFMPFVLIPSSIAAILGYSLSFFIYPLISNSIQDYWILEYIKFSFSPGYLILVFLIITLIIFSVQSIVVFSVLNKNVSTLLVSKLEFKHNKLIQLSHKSASKLKPLSSFRITYMLGNFGRLLLLLLMMTSFVSLTTIFASTTNTFTTAVSKTVQNKKYNYAIDLYSPSEQGGYYYNIPYNLLGSRQQGLTSLYDLNSSTGFYNSDYKDDLTYNIPGTDKSVVYENLFLPSASLIGDVQGNLTFFRNRIFNMATMDFGINFVGNYINPWDWAKKVIPNNMVNTIVQKQQEQLNYAFAYVCSIQDDLNNPDRDIWIWDKSNPNSFKENLHNSSNPAEWSQDNWIFQYIKEDSKYVWKSNEQLLSTGLPNFTMTQSVVNFVTRLISLSQNPNYLKFIENLEKEKNIKVLDNNYMLALNVVPVVEELDETYTYITGNAKIYNSELNNIKIYGIKSDSDQIVLWDENNNVDLKQILKNYELNNSLESNVYPLIINEVVAKKYKLEINDYLDINATNGYKRFTKQFNNIENNKYYRFKILGITTSKSEEQYYTLQSIANTILEYEKPKLATEYDLNGKNYDYKWVNQEEIDSYIPFNGVFSKQDFPKLLSNFATLYSPSGLSPISGTLPTSDSGDAYFQLYNNWTEINSIFKFNIIDENKGKSFETINEFCKNYEKLFGTDKYFNLALSSIDLTLTSSLIGSVIDSTLSNINLICMLSLLPSILIIIILMSYMIVVESKRLVALLKVLGFSNWSNTITLSMVQFVVSGLAIILGYCFSLVVLKLLTFFAFNSFSIIINPIIPLWTIPITIGVLASIVSIITATIYYNLSKSNPAAEIAIR